jgi:hypothetical protein
MSADGVVMATAVLVDAFRRIRASWQGQLVVLAGGSVLLGLLLNPVVGVAGLQVQLLLAAACLLVLVGTSTSVALRTAHGYDSLPSDVATDGARLAPRLLAQGFITLLPGIAAWWLALASSSVHPLLVLLLMPVAFGASVASAALGLLACAAVAHDDRSWLPQQSWKVLRGSPLRVTGSTVVLLVTASAVALPFMLLGMVAVALLGPIGSIGLGLAAAALTPTLGAGSLALWRAAGASIEQPASQADAAGIERSTPSAPGSTSAQSPEAAGAATMLVAAPWTEGPTFNVAIDAGATWGTWLGFDAPAQVAFRVTWHGGGAPELLIAGEDGVWTRPGALDAQGMTPAVQLPPGNTYLQLANGSSAPQAVAVELLVRRRAVA